jgi:hypothetical protein
MTLHAYLRAVRDLYIQLPQTSNRFSRSDRFLASDLFRRQVPFDTIRSALLLVIVNRLYREGPPLPIIRSLHYFAPAINEVLLKPLPPGYVQYLQHKITVYPSLAARWSAQNDA